MLQRDMRGGNKLKPLRQEVDEIARLLLQAVDKLFQVDFKDIIFGVLNREADDDEVNMMVNMYMHLGFLLDGVFH